MKEIPKIEADTIGYLEKKWPRSATFFKAKNRVVNLVKGLLGSGCATLNGILIIAIHFARLIWFLRQFEIHMIDERSGEYVYESADLSGITYWVLRIVRSYAMHESRCFGTQGSSRITPDSALFEHVYAVRYSGSQA